MRPVTEAGSAAASVREGELPQPDLLEQQGSEDPGFIRDLVSLSKPRLSSLVLFTAGGGLWLSGVSVHWIQAAAAVLGTTLVVAGANTLNCYLERDIDKRMGRTRTRPLPAGRLSPRAALIAGLVLSLVSVPMLTVLTTPLAGLLAAIALISYVLVYTPLKQRTSLSTLVGAFPGALPPLIGWTAATGTLDPGGLLLFALLFVWQIPHSLAIGIYRQSEYDNAGLLVFPSEHGLVATHRQILLYSLALFPLPLALAYVGIGGTATMLAGTALGAVFLWLAMEGYRERGGSRWARKLFRFSLIYLTGLFVVLPLDQLF